MAPDGPHGRATIGREQGRDPDAVFRFRNHRGAAGAFCKVLAHGLGRWWQCSQAVEAIFGAALTCIQLMVSR